jgi:nitric oxide reductase NorD protein
LSLEFLEYEEKVGRLWHRLIGEPASWPRFPAAQVELEGARGALAVFFRGAGGEPGLELAAAGGRRSGHRLRPWQRLAMVEERVAGAERTDELVLLPPSLDLLPEPGLNRDLYLWLLAFLAHARPPAAAVDPLRRDLARLRAAHRASRRVLALFPGLRPIHERLARGFLELWPKRRRLPTLERRVESVARGLLGAPSPDPDFWAAVVEGSDPASGPDRAPGSYKPLLPVPLWGEVRPGKPRVVGDDPEAEEDGLQRGDEDAAAPHRRGQRRGEEEEEADERGALTLINKGELLLLAADMVGVNRPDDEEDPDAAQRAAEDMDELALGSRDRKSSSRLRLQLDLDAAAVDPTPVRAKLAYPEWDHRRRAYLPNHCAVLAGTAAEEGEGWQPDVAARRQIRRVRRQFEALRPRRETLRAQLDGHELDTDALVRSRIDLAAGGGGSDAVYLESRTRARDLAALILVDASLSTDAWLEGRRVLDVEKQALTALAWGIDACGDPSAILAFTSRRREVRVDIVKGFDEPLGASVRRRIAALRPGQYTRMGAALRHSAALLEARPERHRLLLLLSDGKPNDVDHYEGRYALEDTRKAVQDARRRGVAVFAVTIDRGAGSYVPHLFGRGGYAIVAHVGGLPDALPRIYRQVAG